MNNENLINNTIIGHEIVNKINNIYHSRLENIDQEAGRDNIEVFDFL